MAIAMSVVDQSPKEFPPIAIEITGLPVMPNGNTFKWITRFPDTATAQAWVTQAKAAIKAAGGAKAILAADGGVFAALDSLPNFSVIKIFDEFPDVASCNAWLAQVNPSLVNL